MTKKNSEMTSTWGWKEYHQENSMEINLKPINFSYSSNTLYRWIVGWILHEIQCQKPCIFYHYSQDQRLLNGSNDNINWLDKLEADPHEYPLPYSLDVWQVLEAEFKKAFINYMAREKAYDDLWKLKMQGGNVNQYVADFQFLASQAEINVNDPAAIRLFQLKLLIPLAEACIDLEKPANFEQWTLAAQVQQHGWIQKKGLQA